MWILSLIIRRKGVWVLSKVAAQFSLLKLNRKLNQTDVGSGTPCQPGVGS